MVACVIWTSLYLHISALFLIHQKQIMVAIVNIKCSLQDQCLTQNIVYQADISNNVDKKKRFNYA